MKNLILGLIVGMLLMNGIAWATHDFTMHSQLPENQGGGLATDQLNRDQHRHQLEQENRDLFRSVTPC